MAVELDRRTLIKTSLGFGAMGLGAFAAQGCGVGTGGVGTGSGSKKKQIVARLSHDLAVDDPYNKGALKFASLADKYTDGGVKVKVYPNASLAPEPEDVKLMKSGALSMALIGGSLPDVDPRWNWQTLPYLFPSYASANKAFESPDGQKILASLSDFGMVGLSYFTNGYRNITNSKHPIVTPADLEGMKIRVSKNRAMIATMEALGARPTAIDHDQLFLALKTKVVDAQEGAASSTLFGKYYEVQKYLSLTKHVFLAVPLVVSSKFWDGLDSDTKKQLSKAAVEAARYERGLVEQADKVDNERLRQKGMIVNSPDLAPFKSATQQVYTKLESDIDGLSKWVGELKAAM